MAEYKEVTGEVMSLARSLIDEFHPYLEPCNIGFVFRDEAGASGGKSVLAKTSKVPENIKPHVPAELDILITIAEDKWCSLSTEQRKALIDHELCHITVGASGWTTKAHDIEEFGEILQRYGLWNRDLCSLQNTLVLAAQMPLPLRFEEPEERGGLVKVEVKHFIGLEPEKKTGDDLIDDAVAFVRKEQHCTISLLQRHLHIGYPRAARLMTELEKLGVIGKGPNPNFPAEREVLIERSVEE